MKILYVITSADQGGAQKYVLTLANHFGGTVAAGTQSEWLFEEAAKQNIKTIRLHHLRREINPIHDFQALSELRKVIEKEQPDIVHLNSTKAGVIGSLVARNLPKIRIIYTVHGFILGEPMGALKRALYGFLERFGAKYRAYTIAVSRADKEALLAARVAPPEALGVVQNGLESIEFLGRAAARQQLNLPAEGLIAGSIANLFATKGIDVLIEAAIKLKRQSVLFIVIGEGPEKPRLEALIEKNNLLHRVHLISQNNAARLLKAFDIFVLPSRKEGLPFALLEAMQAGLPIVATNVGGIPETLGRAGLVVPAENAQELARALEHLIKHQEIRLHLGKRASEQALQFSLRGMLAGTEAVYKKVIS